MKTNVIDLNNIILADDLKNMGYQYVWIQDLRKVEIIHINSFSGFDFSTLLEARVFNEDKELHIFEYDDSFRCVEVIKEEDDECFEERQLLRSTYGRYLLMRHYIGYEDDGQAYIKQSALCGYEGGEF